MSYHEYVYVVLLTLTLGAMLMPQSYISIVTCALLLAAIGKENTWPRV